MKSVHNQKELPPSKIKISSQTPQHTQRTSRSRIAHSRSLVHNASALFCALEQPNADRPNKTQTVDIRFKNEASKTFFPLLLYVLPSRPADPHSPNKNNSKQHKNEGDAQPIVDKRGSTKNVDAFPPSTKLKRRAKREPEASRLQPLTPT